MKSKISEKIPRSSPLPLESPPSSLLHSQLNKKHAEINKKANAALRLAALRAPETPPPPPSPRHDEEGKAGSVGGREESRDGAERGAMLLRLLTASDADFRLA